jgi:hypothetical protein
MGVRIWWAYFIGDSSQWLRALSLRHGDPRRPHVYICKVVPVKPFGTDLACDGRSPVAATRNFRVRWQLQILPPPLGFLDGLAFLAGDRISLIGP